MTIYCILDPTGEPRFGSVSDYAKEAWITVIEEEVEGGYAAETFREDQAELEAKGYRLGRASGVVFERVG